MSYAINGPGFHLDCCDDEFNCPKCTCFHSGKDYEIKLEKSKKGYIYMKCRGCKTMLGISSDYKGDVVVWLKEDEKK